METVKLTVGLEVPVQTSMGVISGKVLQIREYEDPTKKGALASLDVQNYGITQDFFYDNGIVTKYEEERRKSLSRIPAEYKSKYPKDFDFSLYGENMDKQKKTLNHFITKFNSDYKVTGRSLYIFSEEKGTGKTMLACVLANEIMKRYGYCCKYVNAQEYVELYTAKKTEEIDSLKNCILLILDDIGAESTGKDSWTQKIIYNLVDWRYKNHFPTIFTSNFPIEKLKEDDTTVSRVETCIPVIVPNVPIRRNQSFNEVKDFLQRIDEKELENVFE